VKIDQRPPKYYNVIFYGSGFCILINYGTHYAHRINIINDCCIVVHFFSLTTNEKRKLCQRGAVVKKMITSITEFKN